MGIYFAAWRHGRRAAPAARYHLSSLQYRCINGQRAYPLSGRGKDRVAQGWNGGRQRRFAQARGRIVGRQKVHFDWRGFREPQQWERVKIGLRDATVFDSDFLMQGFGESIENRTLRHVHSGHRVDDVAADVADRPYSVDRNLAVRGHRRFYDLGEIAEMAVIEGDALACPLGKFALPPRLGRGMGAHKC